MKREFLCGASAIAVALTAGFWGQSARAAEAAAEAGAAAPTPEAEITVTGSLIVGTPENAALPVTVLSSETIQKQGAPSIIELTKMLPESSGIISESNQFVAGGRGQGQYGTSTINLRGLGPERTLTLFNGHRLPLAFGFAVDTTMLPLAAIGRVEVLKDGAAATYGSDAIGGVVNFITKKNVNGLEAGGDWRFIPGSDGDYTLNATWGHSADNWNVMVAGGFQHRSELDIIDRDWAIRPYDFNPEGGWTGGGNPEAFFPTFTNGLGQAAFLSGTRRLDIGCTAVGGQLTQPLPAAPLNPWTSCRAQYTLWDALEEEQNSYQIYSEFNVNLGGSHKLHVEGLYSYTDIPFFKSSPSYVTTRPVPNTVLPPIDPNQFRVGTSPPQAYLYYVPITNPGFAAYLAANPGQFPAGTTGAFLAVGTFRPYINGGNPLYNYEHGVGGDYWHEQINLSASLKGDVTEAIHYEASLTWGQYKYYGEGRDSLTDRLELALRGLGGPNCNFQTGTPGVGGCQWLNPFSNAIPGSPRRGLVNPYFNPALENTAALADWIMPIQWGRGNFRDIDADFILSGNLWTLPGGDVGWAAGFQWRQNHFTTDYSQYGNAITSPCANSGLDPKPPGADVCTPTGGGPAVFGPVTFPVDLKQNIYALYGEVSLPIFDTLNIDIAGRYEDYGSNGGHTFNPQIRGKWQVTDFFAFRGSAGSTFRAPPQASLIPSPTTNLQFVLGTFLPINTFGDPKLKPEKATTFSVGGILETGGLHATVDYWNYDFKQVLTTEPLGNVVGVLTVANCANPALAPFIASHFVFSSSTCDPASTVAVNISQINGPNIKTDGVDFNASYRWDNVVNGALTIGGVATWVHKYEVAPFDFAGIHADGFNAAGFFNSGTVAYPIPKWKGQAYVNYEVGGFNIRLTARYVDHYFDQRAIFGLPAGCLVSAGVTAACPAVVNPIYVTPTNPTGIVSRGQIIASRTLFDLAIRVPLPYDTTMTAAITNLFDRDPAFARTDLNYDALTGDPLGRTIKLGVQKKF
jgi:iron complex outermembrane receptor protein